MRTWRKKGIKKKQQEKNIIVQEWKERKTTPRKNTKRKGKKDARNTWRIDGRKNAKQKERQEKEKEDRTNNK